MESLDTASAVNGIRLIPGEYRVLYETPASLSLLTHATEVGSRMLCEVTPAGQEAFPQEPVLAEKRRRSPIVIGLLDIAMATLLTILRRNVFNSAVTAFAWTPLGRDHVRHGQRGFGQWEKSSAYWTQHLSPRRNLGLGSSSSLTRKWIEVKQK
jgi:hypothetical protein